MKLYRSLSNKLKSFRSKRKKLFSSIISPSSSEMNSSIPTCLIFSFLATRKCWFDLHCPVYVYLGDVSIGEDQPLICWWHLPFTYQMVLQVSINKLWFINSSISRQVTFTRLWQGWISNFIVYLAIYTGRASQSSLPIPISPTNNPPRVSELNDFWHLSYSARW